jgi:hypothetical protein
MSDNETRQRWLAPLAARAAALALAVTAVLGVASYKRWSSGTKPAAALAPGPPAEPKLGYMPARWRLATFQEVNRVVMWVSHIVIQHKESLLDDPSLRSPGWSPDPAVIGRTKAEALERALLVADLAAKTPEKFAELAKMYSDDVVTKDLGGSLGGVRLGQVPAEYRDALAVLRPGETSRVMQTAFGFHVIQRRPMPPAGEVAGKRIVIRYQGTAGGKSGAVVQRKRDAALALARDVAARARAGAEPFDELVKRFSEGADIAQLGDIGVYSVRDPEWIPREIEQLGSLRVGEVSEPLDTVFGFQILQRTEVTARPRYAMTAISLRYDPSLAGNEENSLNRVWLQASELARSLKKDPSQFESLQKKHCCDEAESWTLGRGRPAVTPVLEELSFGEIASAPVRTWEGLILIPKRLDPASLPPQPAVAYELPSPNGPDFERLIRDADPHGLGLVTHQFAAEVKRALPIEGAAATKLPERIDALAVTFEKNMNDPAARILAFHQTLAELKPLLGRKYGDFETFLNEWGTRLVIMGYV